MTEQNNNNSAEAPEKSSASSRRDDAVDESAELIVELNQDVSKAVEKTLQEQGILKPGARPAQIRLFQEEQRVVAHSGPLPSPDSLHGYGQVNNSFPERIFAMTEVTMAHQRKLDFETLEAQKQERVMYYETVRENNRGSFEIQKLAIIVTLIMTMSAAFIVAIAAFFEITWLISAGGAMLVALAGGGVWGAVKAGKSKPDNSPGK